MFADGTPVGHVTKLLRTLQRMSERNLSSEQLVEQARGIMASLQSRKGEYSRASMLAMELLAERLERAGEIDESLILIASAHERRRAAFGEEDEETLRTEVRLGNVLSALGRHQDAIGHFLNVIEIAASRPARDPKTLSGAFRALSNALKYATEYETIEAAVDHALRLVQAALGADHRTSLSGSFVLAHVQYWRREYAVAIARMRDVVDGYARVGGVEDLDAIRARWFLASWLHRIGEDPEALTLALGVLEAKRRTLGEDDRETHAVSSLVKEIRNSLASP